MDGGWRKGVGENRQFGETLGEVNSDKSTHSHKIHTPMRITSRILMRILGFKDVDEDELG